MKKLFLTALIVSVLVSSANSALVTEQIWSFSTGDNPVEADSGYTNPGMPTATINVAGGNHVLDPGWKEIWLGHSGVWAGDTVDITLDIPNYINTNPYKIIWLDATFFGDIIEFSAEILNPGSGVIDLGATITPNADGWNTLRVGWEIRPNPDFEQIFLHFVNSGAAIDDIYVWTECVPEPMTLALFGLGGLLLRRRKRA